MVGSSADLWKIIHMHIKESTRSYLHITSRCHYMWPLMQIRIRVKLNLHLCLDHIKKRHISFLGNLHQITENG